MNKRISKALLIFALSALVLPLGAVIGHAAIYRNRIYPGVKIARIDMGGLTAEQVERRLRQKITPPDKFVLSTDVKKWEINFSDLGADLQTKKSAQSAFAFGREKGFFANVLDRYSAWSNETSLTIAWDIKGDKARQALTGVAVAVAQPPIDAKLLVDQKIVKLSPHQNGRELRIPTTLKRIRTALLNNGYEAPAAVKAWEPETTTDDLKKLRIETRLAEFSTSLSTARDNRRHNIALAAGKINDTYVSPGSVFSFNKTVGTRTSATGFRTAPVILDGNLVPGIGGGICQVATTLYNAAMASGLPTVERSVHSNFISNYPAGRDATVVDGALDLKFRNDTGGSLLIKGVVTSNAVIFRIYGPNTGRVTVFGTPVVLNSTAFETKTETDTTLPPGARVRDQSGVSGQTVKVSRKVTQGDKVLIEEVTTSRYLPRRELLRVGPAPEETAPGKDASETISSVSQ